MNAARLFAAREPYFCAVLAFILAGLVPSVILPPWPAYILQALLCLFIAGRPWKAERISPKKMCRSLLLSMPIIPACLLNLSSGWQGLSAGGLICILLSALAEECVSRLLIFRKILLEEGGRKPLTACLFSSMLFAAAHLAGIPDAELGYSLYQSVCAFMLGIFFSSTSFLSGSIFGCWAAHALMNICAFGGAVPAAPRLSGAVICAALAVCGLLLIRKKTCFLSLLT